MTGKRAACPKCGMHMIRLGPIHNSKQNLECLRCGHKETRKIDE